jgi:hypothetical protein
MRINPVHCFLSLAAVGLLAGCYDLSLNDYTGGDAGVDARNTSGIEGRLDLASAIDTGASVPDVPAIGIDVLPDINSIVTTDAYAHDAPVSGVEVYADTNAAATIDALSADMQEMSLDGFSETGASVGRLDSPCDTPSVRGCDGPMSRQQTICDGTSRTWRANGTCRAGEYCDRATGDCHAVAPECAGNQPGARVCVNATLHECGPDLLTTTMIDGCATATGECSRCRPVTLATGQTSPGGTVIAGGYVYWSNTGGDMGVFRVPRSGGDVETIAAGHSSYAMATDGAAVYWVDGSREFSGGMDQVYRVAISGGAPTVVAPAGDKGHAGIAVSGAYVYWTTQRPPAVKRALKAGGAVETLVAPDSGDAFGVVVDMGVVYWTNQFGTVMQTPSEGGPTSLLAGNQSSPLHLFVDSTHVYWTNRNGGQIMRILRSGGSPETLASGQAGPYAMAGDASYVYWTNIDGGSVMKMRLDGGSPVVMASGFSSPRGLASDDTSLSWASWGGGTIVLIQK